MADQQGSKPKRKPPLRYFYLHGNLHKKLHIHRPSDTITTWCYPLHKRVAYTYSDLKRQMRPAFKTKEVCKLVNRNLRTVQETISLGEIERPQFTYNLSTDRMIQYLWSEENVLELHRLLSTRHFGRPRNDGLITPAPMPSERELKAIMRNEEILYVKVDGEYKPVWRAEDFT